MHDPLLLLLLVIGSSLVFDFVNGFHDASNAIATSVATRVISPRWAIIMAAGLNLLGALSGTEVAKTVGFGILTAAGVTQIGLLSAVVAAITWNLVTWYYALPSSSSHALMAGLVGAGIATAGPGTLKWAGLNKILAAIILSPLFGFVAAFVVMILMLRIFAASAPTAVTRVTRRLQIVSAAYMAYSHGRNDAQKAMGIMAVAIASYQGSSEPHVPFGVMLAAAVAMGFGTAIGGWRIMRTMGWRLTQLKPIHGFSAEFSAATVIETASHFGVPISTTHTINAAIMGVGSTRRLSAVKWGVGRDIVIAWIITIPACAALSWAVCELLRFIAS